MSYEISGIGVVAMDELLHLAVNDEELYSSSSSTESDEWGIDDDEHSLTDSLGDSSTGIDASIREGNSIDKGDSRNASSGSLAKNLLLEVKDLKEQLRRATESGDVTGVVNLLHKRSPELTGQACDDGVMSLNAIETLWKKKKSKPRYLRSASDGMIGKLSVQIVQAISAQDETAGLRGDPENQVKPAECLKSILGSEAIIINTCSSDSLVDFFVQFTEENINAYSSDLVRAIRSNDINKVKAMHDEGKMLLGCNKFGESVMHMVCRHGSAELLAYFMFEAHLPVRLKDDSGRTPLHDACWTAQPNFDCVRLLLEASPDLLFITDKRGFAPLAYVPRNCWGGWCSFLETNRDLLKPTVLTHLIANIGD